MKLHLAKAGGEASCGTTPKRKVAALQPHDFDASAPAMRCRHCNRKRFPSGQSPNDLRAAESAARKINRAMALQAIHDRCRRMEPENEGAMGCLEWTGMVTTNGYPQKYVNGKKVHLHRLVVELASGKPIREGLHPRLTCRNILCLERSHIKLLTKGEISRINSALGLLKLPLRNAKIAASQRARIGKITEADIIRIRTGGESTEKLAAELGITRGYASRIRSGSAGLLLAGQASIFSLAA